MSTGNSNTGPIDHALRRLAPDVFYHPVWAHFVEAEAPLPRQECQSLLGTVDEMLAAGRIEDACQVLFIHAFQRLRADDYAAASSSTQRILNLAEQHELLHVAACAAWGAAAISVRCSQYQQVAGHLEHLQSILERQREWVLSDVIDIIQQVLLSQPEAAAIDQMLSSDTVLSTVFEQLLRWGRPSLAAGIDRDDLNGSNNHSPKPAAGSSGFKENGLSLWQTIKRIIKGEMRLKWVEVDGSVLPLHHNGHDTLTTGVPGILLAAASDLPPQQPAAEQLPADRPSVPDQPESAANPVSPSITAHLLGTFSVSVNDAAVHNWPTGKGRAILKYLLAHHDQPIPRDMLMDVFWPQAGPEAARNSLNVALHGLRQALKTVTDRPVVLFDEGAYCINPEFQVWVDVDEFDRHVQAARRLEAKEQVTRAVTEYEAAMELYRGDFLSGDLYEDWPVLTRERLRVTYLETLDRLSQIYFDRKQYAACITACQQILARDNCREDAHCLLMQCYCRQGQHHLALRQYQICVEALRSELNVDPAPATTQLYERIRRRERV